MPRKSLEKMIRRFENEDFSELMTQENEVEFAIDIKKSGCFVDVAPELVKEISEIAREKKTTVRKVVEGWIKTNLRKLKAA